MSETAVSFLNVAKRFGSTEVLRDVDLAIAAGRTTAVIGESGSGKSTLLQMINGLVRPDAGEVRVFGERVGPDTVLGIRRRTGYAVQGSALFPHLTVRENVTLLARLEGWSASRREDRLAHLMALVELVPELAGRYPHELSGGQQQRVSLCRAMMLEPPLLLLDEPFSAVDPITRMGIHDHFRRLAASEPVTVVLVTHDLREAVELASELVVLGDGGVARAGAVEAVRSAPGAPWIERLFAEQLG
ncbi:MAG: ATP-binding cassette domain-containing protein [Pseudomonadales bacterium]|jgi:osmoprotectant transport system ATP-binding protein|nr:ATP-binding cassette domain-containing protein [Pseudomonadales bacterium]